MNIKELMSLVNYTASKKYEDNVITETLQNTESFSDGEALEKEEPKKEIIIDKHIIIKTTKKKIFGFIFLGFIIGVIISILFGYFLFKGVANESFTLGVQATLSYLNQTGILK